MTCSRCRQEYCWMCLGTRMQHMGMYWCGSEADVARIGRSHLLEARETDAEKLQKETRRINYYTRKYIKQQLMIKK